MYGPRLGDDECQCRRLEPTLDRGPGVLPLPSHRGGQAVMEFALVFPMVMFLLMAVIVFGLFVFYNQQLENAAREAARYAAVHSSSAQCPTVSRLDPGGPN